MGKEKSILLRPGLRKWKRWRVCLFCLQKSAALSSCDPSSSVLWEFPEVLLPCPQHWAAQSWSLCFDFGLLPSRRAECGRLFCVMKAGVMPHQVAHGAKATNFQCHIIIREKWLLQETGWVKLNLYFLTFRSNTFSALRIIHKHMHTHIYGNTEIKFFLFFFSFLQVPASIFQSAKFLWPGTRVFYQCSPALMQRS